MKPMDELRNLIAPAKGAFVGTVIEIDAERVTVQTARGSYRAARPASLTLAVGDDVLISDGAVQGRVTKAAEVPVYSV